MLPSWQGGPQRLHRQQLALVLERHPGQNPGNANLAGARGSSGARNRHSRVLLYRIGHGHHPGRRRSQALDLGQAKKLFGALKPTSRKN